MIGRNVIPPYRLILAREQRRLQQEQAMIEACERALEARPSSMAELIRRAKASVEMEKRP